MWTRISPCPEQSWTLNHFVPCCAILQQQMLTLSLPQTSLASNIPIQCDAVFSSKKCKRRRIIPEVTQTRMVSAQYSASLKPLDVALNPISKCHLNTPLQQSAQTLSPLSNVLLTVPEPEQAQPDVRTQSEPEQSQTDMLLTQTQAGTEQTQTDALLNHIRLEQTHTKAILTCTAPVQTQTKALGTQADMFLTQTRPEAGELLTGTRADEAQCHSLNAPLPLKQSHPLFVNYT